MLYLADMSLSNINYQPVSASKIMSWSGSKASAAYFWWERRAWKLHWTGERERKGDKKWQWQTAEHRPRVKDLKERAGKNGRNSDKEEKLWRNDKKVEGQLSSHLWQLIGVNLPLWVVIKSFYLIFYTPLLLPSARFEVSRSLWSLMMLSADLRCDNVRGERGGREETEVGEDESDRQRRGEKEGKRWGGGGKSRRWRRPETKALQMKGRNTEGELRAWKKSEKEGWESERKRERGGFINHWLRPDTPACMPPLLNDHTVCVCVCVLCVAARICLL